ncbi:hypothetical protein GGS23DRAFT_597911 [Durotheca rogersii]|uniref:uncharacterized protein n=1 Tax=Durotheca rogersii TaxID=419775 RepID=UPI0022200D67|nr:uncharacterized protein GGS23DRAFT_597911 [Durotheca rogersii]KAI5861888.1 hypothetical protein GGS23DRAFT_597911 [Durotheca rogersii]
MSQRCDVQRGTLTQLDSVGTRNLAFAVPANTSDTAAAMSYTQDRAHSSALLGSLLSGQQALQQSSAASSSSSSSSTSSSSKDPADTASLLSTASSTAALLPRTEKTPSPGAAEKALSRAAWKSQVRMTF